MRLSKLPPRYEHARRFFHKALRFDGSFAPAWVAYGHAFAHHDESDQALAAPLGPVDMHGTRPAGSSEKAMDRLVHCVVQAGSGCLGLGLIGSDLHAIGHASGLGMLCVANPEKAAETYGLPADAVAIQWVPLAGKGLRKVAV